jgi:nucleotide-binding universal stress UspA family protein
MISRQQSEKVYSKKQTRETVIMLKDILVHVDKADQPNGPLEAAIHLAKRYNAHVSGLHVTSLFHYVAAHDVWVAGLWEECKDELRAAAQRAQEQFKAATASAGVLGEWHHVDGDPTYTILDYGRVVDLVVLGQPTQDAPPITREITDKAALALGRPVLFVPFAGFSGSLGKRVLVAWDGGRESARAVNDALPLLVQAEHVVVMSVEPPVRDTARKNAGDEISKGADIALHLARHGVKAETVRDTASPQFVGEKLLEQVERQRADLVVMGAYGHSRVKEIVLGGATRHMLKHATVPVLMSH